MTVSLLIEQLEKNVRSLPTDLVGRKTFSDCKRALKVMAKEEKLTDEERNKIISILHRRGFKENGQGFNSTELLFQEPWLWKVVFRPTDVPEETRALSSLTSAVFRKFIAYFTKLSPPDLHINELIAVVQTAVALKRPNVRDYFIPYLEESIKRASSLSVESFYLVATLVPHVKAPVPSTLKGLIPEHMTGTEIAQEYALFKRMIDGSFDEEKSQASPEQLCRFFLYLDRSFHSTPLGQELFDFLLAQLKAGELDVPFGQALITVGLNSAPLRERTKKDKCHIHLEGLGDIEVQLWPLFLKSDYVRTLVRSQMVAKQTIVLEGNKAKVFYLFYDLWLKNKDIDLKSYSYSELIGFLECMTYFLVDVSDETIIKIFHAIGYFASLPEQPELTVAESNVVSDFESYMKARNRVREGALAADLSDEK